jgi:hypothetical protein
MSSGFQRFLPILPVSLALLAAAAAPAAAADVWTADPHEARVTLPDPQPGTPVTGGTMACAADAWTLTLFTDTGASVAGATGTARIVVPLGTFEAPSTAVPAGIEIAVPRAALEPLMRSTRLSISFVGGTDEIRFPLAGSRRAITAAQGLCSKVEMPLANSVPLTPYSSYLLLTRALRRSDIADFALSTAETPRLRAGMVEIGEGRRLLFSEMCGSTWYYGASGCSLIGYAPVEGKDAEKPEGWRSVYETEGVYLYVDPEMAHEGWPDLLAYSAAAPTEAMRWTWKDGSYVMEDDTASAADAGAAAAKAD